MLSMNTVGLDEPSQVEMTGGTNTRVSVARVGEHLIAYPLDGKWLLSDGIQAADAAKSYRPLHDFL
jgi:hypothetical protein